MTVAIRTYSSSAPIDAMLAPLFALCAWVTLNPYFLWNSLRHMAIAGMLSGCLAIGVSSKIIFVCSENTAPGPERTGLRSFYGKFDPRAIKFWDERTPL